MGQSRSGAELIADGVRELARARPDEPVLLTPDEGQTSGFRWWTRGDLDREVERASHALLGVSTPGEAIAIVMAAEMGSVAALLAAASMDAPAVLLPARSSADELRSALRETGVSRLFVPPGAGAITGVRPAPALRAESRDDSHGWIDFGGTDPGLADDAREVPGTLLPPDSFVVQLTSGSTAPSRLALRSGHGVLTEIRAVTERIGLCSDDIVLCASSIAHSYGLIGGMLATLLAGGRVAMARDAAEACKVAGEVGPSVIFGLSSTYQAVLAYPEAEAFLSPTRLALSAGAPLPSGLSGAFWQRMGFPIRQDYGTTETGTISIDMSSDPVEGAVGEPLPHLQVRLAQPPGVCLEPGEAGEIQVRSPSVALGYVSSRGLAPCVEPDGWYRTRDAGSLDGRGRLRVGRRLRDPVYVGGSAVRLETVEQTISLLPGVEEVVAVAVDDGDGREGIRAIVVAPSLDLPTLHRWCREHLSVHERPATIELRPELARSPAGKILHKYLV